MGGQAKQKREGPKDALTMLERCHERLLEQIDILVEAAGRYARVRSRDALDDARSVAAFLERTGRRHELDEEESVFPRLPASAELDSVVRVLIAEHRDHEREIDFLSTLVAGKPEPEELERCAARLRSAYTAHVALEDERLKPIIAAFPESALAEILAEMQTRRGR